MQIIGKHEDLRKIQTDQAYENTNSRHLIYADSSNCGQITTHDYLDVKHIAITQALPAFITSIQHTPTTAR
jgi:hypothetical protein